MDRIKIRRSNGEIQFVTPDQLDALNQRRKIRDQERASEASINPFSIVIPGLTIVALVAWFVMYS